MSITTYTFDSESGQPCTFIMPGDSPELIEALKERVIQKPLIGITQAGDAGVDLSWVERLRDVDAAVVITRHITPDFYDAVLANKDKLIVHAVLSGFGKSVLEPNVPSVYEEFNAIHALIHAGFPQEKVVIRVDPIIPTEKGLRSALDVLEWCMDTGFRRFRIHVLTMQPEVIRRFLDAGLPLPYGSKRYADREQRQMVDAMLEEAMAYWTNQGHRASELRIESCAEPYLNVPIQCGCISEYDFDLLGLNKEFSDSAGSWKKSCMCYSGRTELLPKCQRCKHKCLYCEWPD